VERIVRGNDPGRFEICDARVRAVYGHSIDLAKTPPIECPPEFLFHGTAQEALAGIFANGLLPMGRRFVHLTAKQDYAIQIAEVRNPGNVLQIDARTAYDRGHVFRRANQHVWLAEIVEPCLQGRIRLEFGAKLRTRRFASAGKGCRPCPFLDLRTREGKRRNHVIRLHPDFATECFSA